MIVRVATVDDIPQLVERRMQLFAEVGEMGAPTEAPALRDATEACFRSAAVKGPLKLWVALADGTLAAAGTLAVFCRPSYPGNLSGREARLLNVYTVPAYCRPTVAAQMPLPAGSNNVSRA